jgi:pyridinium-3,5-bisthiocarboxylic acid mononucleotide nickel chelatase
MRTVYFDCFSGVAGDMILGALVDAGLPLEDLAAGLKALPVGGYSLRARKVTKASLQGTKVDVLLEGDGHPHGPMDLLDIVARSTLPAPVKDRSSAVIRRLAEAEAAVHGLPPDRVHFHELGGTDTIVDVCGAVLGLHLLGVGEVFASPISIGRGFLDTHHGRLPSPPPASVELLKGVPTLEIGVEGEIATPTGCALLKELAAGFGRQPAMVYDRVGYGAGDREFPGFANLLRVLLGVRECNAPGDRAAVLETNLDDLSPQVVGSLYDRLFAAGALDVWTTAAGMKKGRPGIVLSVLAPPVRVREVESVLFAETTTLGVRRYEVDRTVLAREMRTAVTRWGEVRLKVAILPDGTRRAAPEFEDCLALANRAGVPVRDVLEQAQAAARDPEIGS